VGSKLIDKPGLPYVLGYDVPDHSLVNASGVFSGYSRRRTRRNKGPFDKPAAAVQASIATLTKGGMGTVRILFPLPTRSTNTHRRRAAGCASTRAPRARCGARRSPKATPRIARSRFASVFSSSGGASRSRACSRTQPESSDGDGRGKRLKDGSDVSRNRKRLGTHFVVPTWRLCAKLSRRDEAYAVGAE